MGKYIIYWIIIIITQTPCDKNIKTEYSNDPCCVNDTIYINKKMEFDSLDNAIRFNYRLEHIQYEWVILDKILSKVNDCPKVLIDTIWTNDFAEIFEQTGR